MRRSRSALLVALLCAALSVVPAQAEEKTLSGKPFAGITYAGYRADQNPLEGRFPTPEQVSEDLRQLSAFTPRIRTYSAREGDNDIPRAAEQFGLQVIAGAWIDGNATANRAELEAVLKQARSPAVTHVIIGNETQLRQDLSTGRLALLLEEARGRTDKPVSAAEPWGTWMKYPELAQHVDFIAAHVLPYWENVAIEDAVDYVFLRVAQLKARFPGKPVILTETGWPSGGGNRGKSVASPENQARFMKELTTRAKAEGVPTQAEGGRTQAEGLDYLIIEAFDQPWKAAKEGQVGAYWGLFTTERAFKESLIVR